MAARTPLHRRAALGGTRRALGRPSLRRKRNSGNRLTGKTASADRAARWTFSEATNEPRPFRGPLGPGASPSPRCARAQPKEPPPSGGRRGAAGSECRKPLTGGHRPLRKPLSPAAGRPRAPGASPSVPVLLALRQRFPLHAGPPNAARVGGVRLEFIPPSSTSPPGRHRER